jgi:hypothetical protein
MIVISCLYFCGCGHLKWVTMPSDAATVQVPVCHGLMKFSGQILEQHMKKKKRKIRRTGEGA